MLFVVIIVATVRGNCKQCATGIRKADDQHKRIEISRKEAIIFAPTT